MTRPDDVAIRLRVETFALLRRLLPIGILAGALVGPVLVVDSSLGVWLSVGLFSASLFALRVLVGLPLYPAHTFGVEYRYEDRPIDDGRRRCIRCETVTADGVHRRYARQLVVLGVPIHTFAWGSNDFCRDCVGTDPADEGRDGSDPEGEPTGESNAASAATAESDAGRDTSATEAGDPGTEIARRVDLNDETTALEVRRAFEGDDEPR